MKTTIAAMIGAAAAAGLASCSSPPSCEKVVRHVAEVRELDESEVAYSIRRCQREDWSDALRSCAMKAKTDAEISDCTGRAGRAQRLDPPSSSYVSRGKALEAELNLKVLEKLLRAHYVENAQFPIGEVGPTPAASCCEGPSTKCANDASQWDDPVWRAIGFELDEDTYYTYRYRSSDGQTAVAVATGDLDCDSITAPFTLLCGAANGSPDCTLSKPPRGGE